MIGLYLLVPLIVGDMGLVKYFKMRKTYHRLQEEIQHLSDENQKIEGEVRALRSDPVRIEQLARARLGLVRPGEVVYQFEPAASADSPQKPAETSRP
jgi:cell division protein FtsB